MKVREAMTRDVRLVRPDQTIRDAAQLMAELDIGCLPVEDGERLVGMITDRDITVRAIAEGRGPQTAIREIMSTDVKYCYDDQSVDDIARNMADIRVRRLPVVDRNKLLVGILSLGDLAIDEDENVQEEAGEALGGISRPGGQHSQSTSRH